MRIDVAVRVLPVDERGRVALQAEQLTNVLNYVEAKRLAREMLCAANRAEKLALTKPKQEPQKEPLK